MIKECLYFVCLNGTIISHAHIMSHLKVPVKKKLQTYFPIGGELFYMTHIFNRK